MKKILEKIKIVLLVLAALVITMYEIGNGILKSCAYSKYVFGEENSAETLATSQETEVTSAVEQIAKVDATPTGKVALENVGMTAVVDKYSEDVAANCGWSEIKLTQSELELLYTTVYCESGDQELEAQIMVAQTILNRIISNKYPNTLRGVVYQRNSAGKPQFAVINWTDFEGRGWSEDTMAAVHYALAYKGYPADMLYFRDGFYHDFGQPYKRVGDMFFSLAE